MVGYCIQLVGQILPTVSKHWEEGASLDAAQQIDEKSTIDKEYKKMSMYMINMYTQGGRLCFIIFSR